MSETQPMYRLYLRLNDDREVVLAEAPGSPFWSAVYQMAIAWYGENDIRYTFNEDLK